MQLPEPAAFTRESRMWLSAIAILDCQLQWACVLVPLCAVFPPKVAMHFKVDRAAILILNYSLF